MRVADPKLHCVVALDAGPWRLTRAYLGAFQNQVGHIGDDQYHWLCGDCRVVTREKVEGGVGGEGGRGVVQVGCEGVAEVCSWARLGGCGLNVELCVLPTVLLRGASGTAAAEQ